MALTSAQATRLASLQTAYDQLIAGGRPIRIDAAGRRVDYAPADMTKLKSEIDQLNALASTTRRTRGAVRFRL